MLSLIRLEERETRMIFSRSSGFCFCARDRCLVLTAAFCRCAFTLLRSAAYAISRGMSAHAFGQAVENGVCDMKSRIVLQIVLQDVLQT